MKSIYRTLLLTGGIVAAGTASAASYQLCSTSGCRTGGSATVTSTYAQTKYPVVLAHGMGGFSAIAGLDYFYGIPKDLVSNGANVFETQSASFNSDEVRGEELLTQVRQVLAMTGASKVNLIGHSQGSQSVRYVAGTIPSQVASVTAVGGPNTGSPVADVIDSAMNVPVLGAALAPAVSGVINAFFTLVGVGSGQYYSQNSLAGLASLTTAGAAKFNAKFPQGIPTTSCGQGASVVNGVNYYSWGGTGVVTNLLNPADYFLGLTSVMIPGANDGLVPKCSSHLGQVIRDDYYQNHFDEVNQVLGLVSMFTTSPVTLFRNQANRLKTLGF